MKRVKGKSRSNCLCILIGLTAMSATQTSAEQGTSGEIAKAWNALKTARSADNHKVSALEFLALKGQNLRGLDLSCDTMNGQWYDKKRVCKHPIDLQELFRRRSGNDYLSPIDMGDVQLDFSNADFSGANLDSSYFQNAKMYGTDFSGADLKNVDFAGAILIDVDFQNADLTNTNLSYSSIVIAHFSGAKFLNTNISGTEFCGEGSEPSQCANDITQNQIDASWAWDDRPPIFNHWEGEYALFLEMPPLCPSELRDEYEKASRTDKPC